MLFYQIILLTLAYFVGYYGMSYAFLLLTFLTSSAMVLGRFRKIRSRVDLEVRQRNCAKVVEQETCQWLNEIINRFWLTFSPMAADIIVSSIEPVLESFKPPGIKEIKFSQFELGKCSPRVVDAKSYSKTHPNQVKLDLTVVFKAKDMRIELNTVFQPFISAPLEVGEILFEGVIRIDTNLIEDYPHADVLKFCMLEDPTIDFSVKPLVKIDITDLGPFKSALNDLIMSNVRAMMVHPNIYEVDLQTMLNPKNAYMADDPAIGILVVNCISGSDLKKMDQLTQSSDPFLRILCAGENAETKHMTRTLNPEWNETLRLIIRKIEGTMDIELLDWGKVTAGKIMHKEVLSIAQVCQVTDEAVPLTIEMEKGKLELSTFFVPVPEFAGLKKLQAEASGIDIDELLEKEREQALDEVEEVVKEELKKEIPEGASMKTEVIPLSQALQGFPNRQGILRVRIHKAKTLTSQSTYMSPYITFFVVDDEKEHKVYRSPVAGGPNPEWNKLCEAVIPDVRATKLRFKVKSHHAMMAAENLGEIVVDVGSLLLNNIEVEEKWFKMNGKPGSVMLSFYFTPLDLCNDIVGSKEQKKLDKEIAKKSKTPLVNKKLSDKPLGSLNITIHEARKLHSADTDGASDPFVTFSVDKHQLGKTSSRSKTLSPSWQETYTFPSHDPSHLALDFQVFDHDLLPGFTGKRNTSLGSCKVPLDKLPFSGWLDLEGRKTGEILLTVSYDEPISK